MNEAKYPSKERIEVGGVLVHAEGDDLINDPDEAKRQGYKIDQQDTDDPVVAVERVERDGVLIYAEGDVIPAEDEEEIARQSKAAKPKTDDAKSKK